MACSGATAGAIRDDDAGAKTDNGLEDEACNGISAGAIRSDDAGAKTDNGLEDEACIGISAGAIRVDDAGAKTDNGLDEACSRTAAANTSAPISASVPLHPPIALVLSARL